MSNSAKLFKLYNENNYTARLAIFKMVSEGKLTESEFEDLIENIEQTKYDEGWENATESIENEGL